MQITQMHTRPSLPRAGAGDQTLAFLREGYAYIPRTCQRLGSDVFETRLMLRRAVCVSGADAARMFYAPGRFTRNGAMPPSAQRLLQDKGSVQLLDGEAHRRRKLLFLEALSPQSVAALVDLFGSAARERMAVWPSMERVCLHEEFETILCRAACRWAGVPPGESPLEERARSLSIVLDGSGALGARLVAGAWQRARVERWIRRVIRAARSGSLAARPGSALDRVQRHVDADGRPMDTKEAAVE